MLEVDKKSLGYFDMKQLVNMLSQYQFIVDKQKDLLEAFREIDHDADGFIPKDELVKYLGSMGEPLNEDEINYLVNISSKASTNDQDGNPLDLIDLE